MRRLLSVLLASAALVLSAPTANAAGELTPGCVSRPEFAVIGSKPGFFAPVAWRRKRVNMWIGAAPYHVTDSFPVRGFWGRGLWRAQDYRACWDRDVRVTVEFVKAPDVGLARFRSIDVYTF